MTLAFLFPGQGSQAVGMGRGFFDNFAPARLTCEEACDALGFDLKTLMFEGPQETLTLTENAQPALLTVSMMVLSTLLAESGQNIARLAHASAGHSLGEYTALCATGALSLGDALRLVRQRGQAMQKAVPVGLGAMAAILGLDFEVIHEVVTSVDTPHSRVVIANDNCPGQVVISGHTQGVEEACALLAEKGAKRCLMLPVSAPFHSPLMEPAARVMDEALASTHIHAPCIPTYANVRAAPIDTATSIRPLLVEQITGQVRWRETIHTMHAHGITHFIEIGTGKVLTGLGKKITPQAQHSALNNPEDLEPFFNILSNQ
jgi:[acyl-carrier-protein] S-malonyltransferase